MLELATVLTKQLSIHTGEISEFESGGIIVVTTSSSERPIRAYFLRTSNAAPPTFEIGDAVLVAVDADDAHGYVLGGIAPYVPPGAPDRRGEATAADREIELNYPPHAPVEISLARNASDVMHLKGKKIYIEAGEEIQLTCGGGTIRIDRRGKVVVRGTDIVSRARGSNKIKGASVAIN